MVDRCSAIGSARPTLQMISFSLLLVLAIFFPNPTDFQYFIFRTVIALAAAGVAALIPGLLQIKIPAIQAGGALAVLVLVYEFSPASLVSLPPSVPKTAVVSSQTSAPEQTYKVCMGNGGGDSCRSGPTLHSTVITTKA